MSKLYEIYFFKNGRLSYLSYDDIEKSANQGLQNLIVMKDCGGKYVGAKRKYDEDSPCGFSYDLFSFSCKYEEEFEQPSRMLYVIKITEGIPVIMKSGKNAVMYSIGKFFDEDNNTEIDIEATKKNTILHFGEDVWKSMNSYACFFNIDE